jgi:hypothetical protein
LRRTFDHLGVFIDRHVGESICGPARPADLDRIDFGGGAQTENLAGIV